MQLMSNLLRKNQYNAISLRQILCKKNQPNVGIYYGSVDISDRTERWVAPWGTAHGLAN